MYSWIAIVSFLHFGRNKKNPFESDDAITPSEDRTQAAKSPFSRSSTLSKRGRRSFFLKARGTLEGAPEEDVGLLGGSERNSDVTSRKEHGNESESPSILENRSSLQRVINRTSPPKPRHKRIKGFMPDVLHSPDKNSLQGQSESARSKDSSSEKVSVFEVLSNS